MFSQFVGKTQLIFIGKKNAGRGEGAIEETCCWEMEGGCAVAITKELPVKMIWFWVTCGSITPKTWFVFGQNSLMPIVSMPHKCRKNHCRRTGWCHFHIYTTQSWAYQLNESRNEPWTKPIHWHVMTGKIMDLTPKHYPTMSTGRFQSGWLSEKSCH